MTTSSVSALRMLCSGCSYVPAPSLFCSSVMDEPFVGSTGCLEIMSIPVCTLQSCVA